MHDLFGNWLYVNNVANTARFILGEKGKNPLICIGVNPSTATPQRLDATLRRVKGFAHRLGYDGWFMINLYPQRATDPAQLHDEYNIGLNEDNMHWIRTCLYSNTGVNIWAAWGTLITQRPYLVGCLEQIKRIADETALHRHIKYVRWVTVGDLTKDGHPRHPLYLHSESKITDFDIDKYLTGLKEPECNE